MGVSWSGLAFFSKMKYMTQHQEKTHRHRNIIDDILDLGLTIGCVVWYFFGFELDAEKLAMVGAAGASARAALRRILMRLWGEKLGIDPKDVQEALSENEEGSEPNVEDGQDKAEEA